MFVSLQFFFLLDILLILNLISEIVIHRTLENLTHKKISSKSNLVNRKTTKNRFYLFRLNRERERKESISTQKS